MCQRITYNPLIIIWDSAKYHPGWKLPPVAIARVKRYDITDFR